MRIFLYNNNVKKYKAVQGQKRENWLELPVGIITKVKRLITAWPSAHELILHCLLQEQEADLGCLEA